MAHMRVTMSQRKPLTLLHSLEEALAFFDELNTNDPIILSVFVICKNSFCVVLRFGWQHASGHHRKS
jgi:hypothetical protein